MASTISLEMARRVHELLVTRFPSAKSQSLPGYLWEAIPRELVSIKPLQVPLGQTFLYFDPHPSNAADRKSLCAALGVEDGPGLEGSAHEFLEVLAKSQAGDFYLFNQDLALLAIGTHEDSSDETGQRLFGHLSPA